MTAQEQTGAFEVWRAARTGAGEPPPPARIERIRAKLADPAAQLVTACRGKQVVGMALCEQYFADQGRGEPVVGWGHVSMVFVDPSVQGTGVGRELLGTLVEDTRWNHLSLWTRCSNVRAQALYRGAGFLPTGELGLTTSGEPMERWQRDPL